MKSVTGMMPSCTCEHVEDGVVILPSSPELLEPSVSSAMRISFLVVPQFFRMLFSMILIMPFVAVFLIVACSSYLAVTALLRTSTEYFVY